MIATIHVPGTRENSPNFSPFPEKVAGVGTSKRREQDIRMMQAPQHWPNIMLPMKRYRDERMQLAVWDGTTLHIDAVWFGGQMIEKPKSTLHATPEEIVAQGWTVD